MTAATTVSFQSLDVLANLALTAIRLGTDDAAYSLDEYGAVGAMEKLLNDRYYVISADDKTSWTIRRPQEMGTLSPALVKGLNLV